MSTAWPQRIGSFLGGSLAGPIGILVGGAAGTVLGRVVEGIDDPIVDTTVALTSEAGMALLGRLNPTEKQQINHDLQTAFRDAFREALYDVGGTLCFAEVWKSSPRALPADLSAPLIALNHAQEALAAQVGERLQALEQALDEGRLFALQPLENKPAATAYAYLAPQPPDDLEATFFELVWPHLGEIASLQHELKAHYFDLRAYLRHRLYARTLIHLDEHLKQRPLAWRAFNRLLLESIQSTLTDVQAGMVGVRDEQRVMSQKQEALRAWSERIEQQLAQQASPLERAVLDAALVTLDEQIRDHFEQMSTQIEAGFAQVRALQAQIEGLPERIRAMLGAAEERLQTKATLARYLEAVIGACDTIYLPYSQQSEASFLLERVYVALRADRSSPVERRASNQLFLQFVREQEAQGEVDESVLYQIAALNPYAARYLLYDELRAGLLKRKQAEQERTFHLAEIVRTHRWLVLLGHPGSGKTTLARWLALQLARAVQKDQEMVAVRADHVRPDGQASEEEALGVARLPIWVRIADYAAARWQAGIDTHLPLPRYLGQHISQLLDQAERKAAIYALLDEYLAKKRVIFILDGLDEVTDAQQRNLIVAQIEDIIRDHVCDAHGDSPLTRPISSAEPASLLTGNQLIVTSRIVGYQLRPLHENLPHFVIQPMDEKAVRHSCQPKHLGSVFKINRLTN